MPNTFTEALNRLKQIPTPNKNVIDGQSRLIDGKSYRIQVFTNHYQDVLDAVKRGL